jgi:5-methylcytosine-specific restriction protein A
VLYREAAQEGFRENEIASLLTIQLPREVESLIAKQAIAANLGYVVKGSAGKGQWTHCPWVAILDPSVSDSAQRGFYPVYLFCEDMSGVFLSLNQGVTDVKEQYKSNAKRALESRASDFRLRLGADTEDLPLHTIDLKSASGRALSSDYEAGNIVAKFYEAGNLPTNEELEKDLVRVLELYEGLVYSIGVGGSVDHDAGEFEGTYFEDYSSFRYHQRIERNPSLVKAVKRVHGLLCEACGIDFRKAYKGIQKRNYIEAHHLHPVSDLKGQGNRMNVI